MRLALALASALLLDPVARSASATRPQESREAEPQATPADAPARALWASGQRREAIAAVTLALEADPEDSELRALLVTWLLRVHRYEAALSHMSHADTRRGPALSALGRCAEALEHLAPSEPEHVELRVECLHRLGLFQEASAAASKAEELLGNTDPRILFWRGRTAAEAGELAGAIDSFRAALEQDPIHMAALFGLGRALARSGEAEEAQQVLAHHRALIPLIDELDFAHQGLDLDPAHAPNIANLAEIEAKLGLVSSARGHFSEAESRARAGQHVPIALRHARFLEELDGPEAALVVLERALSVGDDVWLRVRTGDVLARAERKREARAQYAAAQALRPEDKAIAARIAGLEVGP